MKIESSNLSYEVYLVDGSSKKRLAEHRAFVEYGEQNGRPSSAACWIPSQTNQTLNIFFHDMRGSYDTEGSLFVDGTLVKLWTTGKDTPRLLICAVDVSPDTMAPLKFVPRRKDGSNATRSDTTVTDRPEIGQIAVRLRAGKRVEAEQKNCAVYFRRMSSPRPPTSNWIEHEVGLGAVIAKVGQPASQYGFEAAPECGEPIWFRFNYRSQKELQILSHANRSGTLTGVSSPPSISTSSSRTEHITASASSPRSPAPVVFREEFARGTTSVSNTGEGSSGSPVTRAAPDGLKSTTEQTLAQRIEVFEAQLAGVQEEEANYLQRKETLLAWRGNLKTRTAFEEDLANVDQDIAREESDSEDEDEGTAVFIDDQLKDVESNLEMLSKRTEKIKMDLEFARKYSALCQSKPDSPSRSKKRKLANGNPTGG